MGVGWAECNETQHFNKNSYCWVSLRPTQPYAAYNYLLFTRCYSLLDLLVTIYLLPL